jgi:monoterpene epsilon-lactone hydrolase
MGSPNQVDRQTGAVGVADESSAQRLIAGVIRGLMRATMGPSLRVGRPMEQRRRREARLTRLMRTPPGVEFRSTVCGSIPAESVTVRGAPPARRAVLYLHGGGYCQGSPATHRIITGQLALQSAARVVAADYRLAPEKPFPAAVEDAVAAYNGLLADGFAPSATVIAGDSAGGGLAVAAALRLHRDGLPQPAALVLFSPWVDLGLGALGLPPPGEFIVTKPWLEECVRFYLAGHPATDPLASPIAADLRGLPPTLIQVGTDELLLTDSRRLHAALTAAGVEATLQEFAHRWHVFQLNAGVLTDANRALASAGAFVRARASDVSLGG